MSKLQTCAGCVATDLREEAADVLLRATHRCWIATEAPKSRSDAPSGLHRSSHATGYRCCAQRPVKLLATYPSVPQANIIGDAVVSQQATACIRLSRLCKHLPLRRATPAEDLLETTLGHM